MAKSALKKPASAGAAKGKAKAKKVTLPGGAGKTEKVGKAEAEKKQQRAKDKRRGVMYMGHIPHGYYEGQMRSFLSQYGKIKRLRMSRSKKSGASKGYGFVQFEDHELAEAVAEELNGTYVTGKVMQCHVMPPEKVHADIWKGMKVKTLIKKDQDIRINGQVPHYQKLSSKPAEARLMDLVTRERLNNEKLQKAGIDYKFAGFESQLETMGLEYVPRAKASDSAEKGVLATMAKKKAAPKKTKK